MIGVTVRTKILMMLMVVEPIAACESFIAFFESMEKNTATVF